MIILHRIANNKQKSRKSAAFSAQVRKRLSGDSTYFANLPILQTYK
jgi:hypothetical protein